jgi:hypothetical protein
MEYVGLDIQQFNQFMQEMVIVYTEISKEKAKIYYEFLKNEKITIEELNTAKQEIYKTKTSNWFPTMAEIRNTVLENRNARKDYNFLDTKPLRM